MSRSNHRGGDLGSLTYDYVAAFAGSRDHYQAAVALQEVGRLSCLVTDFYTPDVLLSRVVPRRLRGVLGRRHSEGLPSSRTRSVGIPVRTPREFKDFAHRDARLGRAAAQATREAALIYSYHWSGFRSGQPASPGGPPHVVFQVHPVAAQVRAALKADRDRWGIDAPLEAEERLTPAEVRQDAETLRTADGFICTSQYVRDGLQQMGACPSAIVVAPYGSDRFLPATAKPQRVRRVRTRPLQLLWVGQLSYRKAPHWLLASLALLPRGAAELTIVSRSAAPRWLGPLPAGVRLLQDVGSRHLQDLFARSDVFVLPSLVEGFGLVYLEALNAGLPVIATNRSGVPDVVGGTGGTLLVDPERPDSLTEALHELCTSPDLVDDLTAAVAGVALPTWVAFRREVVSGLASLE